MTAVALIVGFVISLSAQFPEYNQLPPDQVMTSPVFTAIVRFRPASETASSSDAVSLRRILAFERRMARKGNPAEQELIAKQIVYWSRQFGVEPELVAALIAKESRFNPRASRKGDGQGLGRLNYGTARRMGVKNVFDIRQNVRGSIFYLKQMMDVWRGRPDRIERALASYNAGAGAVRRRGPGVSRGFINSILKYRSEMIKADMSLIFNKSAPVSVK